jgi:hypothetical protein
MCWLMVSDWPSMQCAYTTEFDSQDWPVASVRLLLDDVGRTELEDIAPELAGVTTAEVTRHYSGELRVAFTPAPRLRS